MDSSFPAPPADRLDGWRLAETRIETPFSLGLVVVTLRTARYEDERPGDDVRARTGIDAPSRFFVTGRLTIPGAGPWSGALLPFIAERVAEGFEGQLRERGFVALRRTPGDSHDVGRAGARIVNYEGIVEAAGATFEVEALVAVWAQGGGFLLAGGAYPTKLLDGGDLGDEARAGLDSHLGPGEFRTELLALVRETR
jgi:hypothetical protein